jgi:hypothetical protein
MTDISRTADGRNSELAFHPLADIFPLMEGAEFDALVADIKANGLFERIILFEGMILDGRNRYRALLAAGFDPADANKFTIDGAPFVDDPAVFVISANLHRRHLTAEQKRDVIAKLLKVQPQKSNRQIAKTAGVSHPHVAKVRAEMEKAGDVETVTTSIDTRGRKQPAKKGWSRERYKAHRAGKKAKTSKVMVTEANGKTRQATEAEVSTLNDAVKRVGEFGIPTECKVEAALANPIIKAWRAADDFNRANFVRLYRKDIEQEFAALDHGEDPDADNDDGLDIPECLRRSAP